MNKEAQPSQYQHVAIYELLEKFQGDLPAIVMLKNADGSTTYLNYSISPKDTHTTLHDAYCCKCNPNFDEGFRRLTL